MQSFKKKLISLFCAFSLAISATACSANSSTEKDSSENSSASESITNSDSALDSDSVVDSEPPTSSEETPPAPDFDEQQAAIVDLAYSLDVNEFTLELYRLTGTVVTIKDPYNGYYQNVSIIIEIKGREDYPILCYRLQGDGIKDIAIGDTVTVEGYFKNYKGTIEFNEGCQLITSSGGTIVTPPDIEDPYADVSKSAFYANYTLATSNEDAYYRSLHGFMSGTLTVPDQAPVDSAYKPTQNGKYIRNETMLFDESKTAYTVVDAYGKAAFTVYKAGAYITLEEVAAYVYAFGTYPANHTTSKNTEPDDSIWGEYLRLNHTQFSGNTSKYPYEPELPNISGCGGALTYYEMDIGTTGTDCDPGYVAKIYNNGNSITRGAARIVYGKNDLDKDGVFEIGEFHVFYTYNHYNDFQEYLNYVGGWGEMFGNITGGGTISSKNDYNPTDYVEVTFASLVNTPQAALLSLLSQAHTSVSFA